MTPIRTMTGALVLALGAAHVAAEPKAASDHTRAW
jgi:hypothetical protein